MKGNDAEDECEGVDTDAERKRDDGRDASAGRMQEADVSVSAAAERRDGDGRENSPQGSQSSRFSSHDSPRASSSHRSSLARSSSASPSPASASSRASPASSFRSFSLFSPPSSPLAPLCRSLRARNRSTTAPPGTLGVRRGDAGRLSSEGFETSKDAATLRAPTEPSSSCGAPSSPQTAAVSPLQGRVDGCTNGPLERSESERKAEGRGRGLKSYWNKRLSRRSATAPDLSRSATGELLGGRKKRHEEDASERKRIAFFEFTSARLLSRSFGAGSKGAAPRDKESLAKSPLRPPAVEASAMASCGGSSPSSAPVSAAPPPAADAASVSPSAPPEPPASEQSAERPAAWEAAGEASVPAGDACPLSGLRLRPQVRESFAEGGRLLQALLAPFVKLPAPDSASLFGSALSTPRDASTTPPVSPLFSPARRLKPVRGSACPPAAAPSTFAPPLAPPSSCLASAATSLAHAERAETQLAKDDDARENRPASDREEAQLSLHEAAAPVKTSDGFERGVNFFRDGRSRSKPLADSSPPGSSAGGHSRRAKGDTESEPGALPQELEGKGAEKNENKRGEPFAPTQGPRPTALQPSAQWMFVRTGGEVPSPRCASAAAAWGDAFFFFGGLDANGLCLPQTFKFSFLSLRAQRHVWLLSSSVGDVLDILDEGFRDLLRACELLQREGNDKAQNSHESARGTLTDKGSEDARVRREETAAEETSWSYEKIIAETERLRSEWQKSETFDCLHHFCAELLNPHLHTRAGISSDAEFISMCFLRQEELLRSPQLLSVLEQVEDLQAAFVGVSGGSTPTDVTQQAGAECRRAREDAAHPQAANGEKAARAHDGRDSEKGLGGENEVESGAGNGAEDAAVRRPGDLQQPPLAPFAHGDSPWSAKASSPPPGPFPGSPSPAAWRGDATSPSAREAEAKEANGVGLHAPFFFDEFTSINDSEKPETPGATCASAAAREREEQLGGMPDSDADAGPIPALASQTRKRTARIIRFGDQVRVRKYDKPEPERRLLKQRLAPGSIRSEGSAPPPQGVALPGRRVGYWQALPSLEDPASFALSPRARFGAASCAFLSSFFLFGGASFASASLPSSTFSLASSSARSSETPLASALRSLRSFQRPLLAGLPRELARSPSLSPSPSIRVSSRSGSLLSRFSSASATAVASPDVPLRDREPLARSFDEAFALLGETGGRVENEAQERETRVLAVEYLNDLWIFDMQDEVWRPAHPGVLAPPSCPPRAPSPSLSFVASPASSSLVTYAPLRASSAASSHARVGSACGLLPASCSSSLPAPLAGLESDCHGAAEETLGLHSGDGDSGGGDSADACGGCEAAAAVPSDPMPHVACHTVSPLGAVSPAAEPVSPEGDEGPPPSASETRTPKAERSGKPSVPSKRRDCVLCPVSLPQSGTGKSNLGLLLYGGIGENNQLLKDVWLFDLQARRWSAVSPSWMTPPQFWFVASASVAPPGHAYHTACVSGLTEAASQEVFRLSPPAGHRACACRAPASAADWRPDSQARPPRSPAADAPPTRERDASAPDARAAAEAERTADRGQTHTQGGDRGAEEQQKREVHDESAAERGEGDEREEEGDSRAELLHESSAGDARQEGGEGSEARAARETGNRLAWLDCLADPRGAALAAQKSAAITAATVSVSRRSPFRSASARSSSLPFPCSWKHAHRAATDAPAASSSLRGAENEAVGPSQSPAEKHDAVSAEEKAQPHEGPQAPRCGVPPSFSSPENAPRPLCTCLASMSEKQKGSLAEAVEAAERSLARVVLIFGGLVGCAAGGGPSSAAAKEKKDERLSESEKQPSGALRAGFPAGASAAAGKTWSWGRASLGRQKERRREKKERREKDFEEDELCLLGERTPEAAGGLESRDREAAAPSSPAKEAPKRFPVGEGDARKETSGDGRVPIASASLPSESASFSGFAGSSAASGPLSPVGGPPGALGSPSSLVSSSSRWSKLTTWQRLWLDPREAATPAEISNALFEYYVDSNVWVKCEASGDKPSPRIRHSAAVVGAYMLVYGGRGADGALCCMSTLYRLHIPTKTWVSISLGGVRVPRTELAAGLVLNNCLYAFGGHDSQDRVTNLMVAAQVGANLAARPKQGARKPRPKLREKKDREAPGRACRFNASRPPTQALRGSPAEEAHVLPKGTTLIRGQRFSGLKLARSAGRVKRFRDGLLASHSPFFNLHSSGTARVRLRDSLQDPLESLESSPRAPASASET
ncbi:hypothetical protein BESB_048240 [Besnoitia besnoiti]|uniref:Kelch repeat-containing protein n=1 Tax=Besnoitia besnoiti TaxID=94643 RepID=A0A2A9MM93_BESBE|nr:hypothetical protein BESB_048240 [Besnoitia besnoiti]PFH36632.1 hypothetical protein BESB_048240 [Besnoitia besnoiti]